jgi:hypothetical protein
LTPLEDNQPGHRKWPVEKFLERDYEPAACGHQRGFSSGAGSPDPIFVAVT